MCFRATTACTFSTSQLPKVLRDPGAFNILTSKCASRHNGIHFFNISTSKSGPTMVCFVHFDLEMRFAPQRCALFRHLNFQKWLRATKACTFSTSEPPKVVRTTGVFNMLTSKCASRHTGVHFFDIPTSKSAPRPRCFVEKHSVSRLSHLFAHLNLLSSNSFSSTLLSSNLSLLSASSLLCFSSAHIVGSLTSKLPSVIMFLLLLLFSSALSRAST